MATIQHSVDLSRSERSSSNVQGYKVYRAGVSGGPYAAVVSANPGTTFVDGFVQSGSKIPLTAARSDGLPITLIPRSRPLPKCELSHCSFRFGARFASVEAGELQTHNFILGTAPSFARLKKNRG